MTGREGSVEPLQGDQSGQRGSLFVASIKLHPVRILHVLCVIEGLLVVTSLAVQLVRYVGGHKYVYGMLPPVEYLFNVDQERNVTSLFSVFLLLVAAALLALISLLKRQQRDPDISKWVILTCGFIYLSADEGWSFHEKLIPPVRDLLGQDGFGLFHVAWVLPALAAVLMLVPLFLNFLQRLPSPTRWHFLGAAAIYLGGAIGIEMIGGAQTYSYGKINLTYQVLAHLEEGMEMAGIVVFIYALLRYLAEHCPKVQFEIGDSKR